MKDIQEKNKRNFFYRWFLNNKIVTSLLIVLLILLIVLVFTKVSHIFKPIGEFLGIVGVPILIAGLLYYLLNPIVNFMEKKGIKRVLGISILFVVVIGLFTWGIVIVVPKIDSQIKSFVTEWPSYWKTIESKINEFLSTPLLHKFSEPIEKYLNDLFSSISTLTKSLSKTTFKGLGSFVGVVANAVMTVIIVPFVLFYLLKDGKKLVPYTMKAVPTKMRQPTLNVLSDINKQLSSYVRGKVTVAIAVGIMFTIGFSIIRLEYAVTLGILAGVLNLIPYIGSALAMIPAVILAMVSGPKMLIAVIIVFIIEQTIEGRVVSPLVLGSQLDIHPLTIIFVLLTAGKLFGVLGVILGVPGYAAIKVVVLHVFEWYKDVSGLYDEPEETST
ncbi:AI-2E family transporter [Vagococcus jeotgali]|uniref:AI-2E family transporter n=1 Tax=Vagococcus jeotgali TaxID=3109030 RepID=UPI002DD849ED|nr:AI-2E family transporter [Vagococcus sp. B2T-5]